MLKTLPNNTQQMNPEVKKLWLEALESEEFQQGQGSLRVIKNHADPFSIPLGYQPQITIQHCCLGVLCEVYKRATGLGHWADRTFYDENGSSNSNYLPPSVREWAGLSSNNPAVVQQRSDVNGEVIWEKTLSSVNDSQSLDGFKTVAKMIREGL